MNDELKMLSLSLAAGAILILNPQGSSLGQSPPEVKPVQPTTQGATAASQDPRNSRTPGTATTAATNLTVRAKTSPAGLWVGAVPPAGPEAPPPLHPLNNSHEGLVEVPITVPGSGGFMVRLQGRFMTPAMASIQGGRVKTGCAMHNAGPAAPNGGQFRAVPDPRRQWVQQSRKN